jgi:hypothetical protein
LRRSEDRDRVPGRRGSLGGEKGHDREGVRGKGYFISMFIDIQSPMNRTGGYYYIQSYFENFYRPRELIE